LEVDDAETFEVEPAAFDLVFSDIVLPFDRMVSLFDRWWSGVKPDGRLVLRDGREPRTPSVKALVDELRGRTDLRFEVPAPGVFSIVTHR
jgi:hypothetical protein